MLLYNSKPNYNATIVQQTVNHYYNYTTNSKPNYNATVAQQ